MAKLKELQNEKYVINFVDICGELDPSKTNKYVPYMLGLLEEYINEVRLDYKNTHLKEITNLVNDFHDLAERNQIENKAKSTSGVNNINSEELKSLIIPLCSIKEQHQIVEILESKLTVCDKIEETISQSLQQAETLKQSILKKAFEGKLVP